MQNSDFLWLSKVLAHHHCRALILSKSHDAVCRPCLDARVTWSSQSTWLAELVTNNRLMLMIGFEFNFSLLQQAVALEPQSK